MYMCDSMLGKVSHSTISLRGLYWVKKKVVFSNAKKREEKMSEKRTKFFYCKKVLEILRTAGTIMDVIWDFDDVLESCISVS